MHRFLIKLACFLALGCAWLVANYTVNRVLFAREHLIAGEPRVLVAGDSYLQRSLDPQHLPGYRNISQLGAPPYLTYYTLDHLIEQEPQLEVVMLILSYHTLSDFHDEKLAKTPQNVDLLNKFYMLPQLPRIEGVPLDLRSYSTVMLKRMCLYPSLRHDDMMGKFSRTMETRLGNHETVLQRQFYDGERVRGLSAVSRRYIWKMVALCREQGVRPLFLATPVHADFRRGVPEHFIEAFDALKAELRADGVAVWDYHEAAYTDEEFFDCNHLNTRGAKRFSATITERLSAGE